MSEAPHIFTLTGNLLAERTLEFETWEKGKTQRARAESFQAGGKGINVSKMLTRLGAPNTALCFAGGRSGEDCEAWLRAKGLAYRAFPTSANTRTGTVVRGRGQIETTFLGVDAVPDAAAVDACVALLERQPTGTVLAVCGSLPGWDTPIYDGMRELLHRWPERGSLVVDTHGAPLAWLVERAAALVRVNRSELAGLFDQGDPTTQRLSGGEWLRAARDRHRALRWALSDGAAPVWYIDGHGEPESILAPRVVEISPTGSGDVMLACILYGRFHRGMGWREAVAWALPYAAANAAHPGVAEFPEPEI